MNNKVVSIGIVGGGWIAAHAHIPALKNRLREKHAAELNKLFADVKVLSHRGRKAEATIFTHYMYMFYYDKKKEHDLTNANKAG